MAVSVRRLGLGDEGVLELLALEDWDFDVAGRGGTREPLSVEAAGRYLSDPNVLHWVAETLGEVLGHLQCTLVRKQSGEAAEVLVYEIGVRSAQRRKGIGRALLAVLEAWMDERHMHESWVLADNPGAVAFYRACGFEIPAPPPTYLTRTRRGPS
jgi:ribosomal protein S18 acetylase RimI-like enzyme